MWKSGKLADWSDVYQKIHSHEVSCTGPTSKFSQQGLEKMPKQRADAKYKNSRDCTSHANVHDFSSVEVNIVPCICISRLTRATFVAFKWLVPNRKDLCKLGGARNNASACAPFVYLRMYKTAMNAGSGPSIPCCILVVHQHLHV